MRDSTRTSKSRYFCFHNNQNQNTNDCIHLKVASEELAKKEDLLGIFRKKVEETVGAERDIIRAMMSYQGRNGHIIEENIPQENCRGCEQSQGKER